MLETKRLILRKFEKGDFQLLLDHRSDPVVMKYLGGIQDEEKVRSKIKLYTDAYERDGYGFCPMIWKATGEFIGIGGMQASHETGETEVGYTVDPKYWGKGIASECTIGSLELGFSKFGLDRIIARTHSENAGSIRVLEKAGMTFDTKREDESGIWVQYAVTRDEFNGN